MTMSFWVLTIIYLFDIALTLFYHRLFFLFVPEYLYVYFYEKHNQVHYGLLSYSPSHTSEHLSSNICLPGVWMSTLANVQLISLSDNRCLFRYPLLFRLLSRLMYLSQLWLVINNNVMNFLPKPKDFRPPVVVLAGEKVALFPLQPKATFGTPEIKLIFLPQNSWHITPKHFVYHEVTLSKSLCMPLGFLIVTATRSGVHKTRSLILPYS